MRGSRGRVVVVESLTELRRRLDGGARRLAAWRVVGLDLRGEGHRLLADGVDVAGASLVGCLLDDDDVVRLEHAGAVVLPGTAAVPVDVHRGTLYAPDELYDVEPYQRSLDARAYAWAQAASGPDDALAMALHDHGVDAALGRWRRERSLVGVMGGHAADRGTTTFTDAARLGRLLGARHTVVSGGGPGAMEAANLGAALAGHPEAVLREAVGRLAAVPSFRPSVDAWVGVAREVRDAVPDRRDSLGVPTWFYGHEPPNLFATAVAKLFRNSLREALLLEICDAGIAVLPGAAGTVQEIFQDACENYYAEESSVAPVVLVGVRHWTEELPAWPLLQALARGRAMEPHVHLVDTVEEAADLLA